jgi:PEP-CTERM motif
MKNGPPMLSRRVLSCLAVIFVLAVASARAGTIVLTFEGLQDEEQVLNYYNGGFGGNGSGPGPNFGITFGPDSLAIISGAAGGSGNFSGAPTMPTVLFFLSGPGDVMDVPAGFTTGFSFFYSAVVYPGSVSVYSGLDGTGSLLASLGLAVTPSGGATQCTYGDYCPWFPVGVSFDGTAESVIFSGSANYIGFDNITLGASTPSAATPEPATLTLFGSGLLGLVGLVRRRRKIQSAQ